jgi:hypothetical protein
MMLSYLVGVDFNARAEIDSLIVDLGRAAAKSRSYLDQLMTIIDIRESLTQSRTVGFVGIAHKWSATVHEDLFLYSNLGVMGAVNVPGNGRAQTFDLGLVGSARVERSEPTELATHDAAFSAAMSSRRKGGKYHDWN